MSAIASISTLKRRLSGTVYTPGEDGYSAELAGFNTAAQHTPEIVVRVESAGDIAECVRFARDHGLRVSVQGAGHGGITPIRSGLLVSTKALTSITIDEHARSANVGAGVRFRSLVEAATPYGLLPISGSSADVGVVGYLLGGGLGPLSRSHGFSSDYVESFSVVTGKGDHVTANAAENQDLFWALRGGKGHGLGVVTELGLRLVELRTLYAGSLAFDESQIPAALAGYLAWTESADPRVTTSAAIIRYPAIDAVPEALRGRCILQLRFAFPGSATEGSELAAPLRGIAPIYLDALGELRAADIARIHDDPSEPMPARVGAMLLGCRGPELLSPLLAQCGPGVD
ncbi:MAG TPA: FAD-binding oxidoreductase, partial [Polyangiaceae bacterium]|nr:FAD-binding oxidoreductase [Polyangiaceae bacterium]